MWEIRAKRVFRQTGHHHHPHYEDHVFTRLSQGLTRLSNEAALQLSPVFLSTSQQPRLLLLPHGFVSVQGTHLRLHFPRPSYRLSCVHTCIPITLLLHKGSTLHGGLSNMLCFSSMYFILFIFHSLLLLQPHTLDLDSSNTMGPNMLPQLLPPGKTQGLLLSPPRSLEYVGAGEQCSVQAQLTGREWGRIKVSAYILHPSRCSIPEQFRPGATQSVSCFDLLFIR